MTNTKICPVCGAALAASRIAQWPSSVVCGRSRCSKTYKRSAYNTIRRRYRHKRIAADPEFRRLEIERRRAKYVLERLRLGKTPALREPIPAERSAFGTFISTIRRSASEALAGAARAVRSICG